MTSDLPSPKPSQAFVHASVLEAGHIRLDEALLVQGGSPMKSWMFPAMAFLLRHSQSGKKIVFDLGLRKDWHNSPPGVQKFITDIAKGVDIPVDVVESLHRGGLEPDDVDFIILSHIHFDHAGNPDLFPTSRFIVGGDAKPILAQGYSAKDTKPGIDAKDTELAIEARVAKDLLPEDRTTFIFPDDWTPLGPFPRALDFFGDGSVYLVDAPGHVGGHINLLARTSAEASWVYLGGDSVHDMRILTGEKEIAIYPHPVTGSPICMHADVELAKEHISRVRCLRENPKVLVLMAHDIGWYEENKDKGVIFPGKICSIQEVNM